MISRESNQFSSVPRSNMICRAPTQTDSSTRPSTSTGGLRRALSILCIDSQVSPTATKPTGMLMKKIQGQEALSEM